MAFLFLCMWSILLYIFYFFIDPDRDDDDEMGHTQSLWAMQQVVQFLLHDAVAIYLWRKILLFSN